MTCSDKAGNANQGHVESGLWFILCCLCITFCFVLNSDFLPNTQEMYTDIPDCYYFWKIERWGMIQLASQRFTAPVCPCQVGVPPSSRIGPGLPPRTLSTCSLYSFSLLLGPVAFAFQPQWRGIVDYWVSNPAVLRGLHAEVVYRGPGSWAILVHFISLLPYFQ